MQALPEGYLSLTAAKKIRTFANSSGCDMNEEWLVFSARTSVGFFGAKASTSAINFSCTRGRIA
jgi:hypothetical protein